MPYVITKYTDRNHCECIKPVGPVSERKKSRRPGPGSVWQCPNCKQYWEVVEAANGPEPPFKWEQISDDRARLLISSHEKGIIT